MRRLHLNACVSSGGHGVPCPYRKTHSFAKNTPTDITLFSPVSRPCEVVDRQVSNRMVSLGRHGIPQGEASHCRAATKRGM